MTDLIRRLGDVVRRSGSDLESPARSASSTERVSFDGELVTWAELPAKTRREAERSTALLAEDVQPDPRVWQEDSHPFQAATGWRFYEDAVVLAPVRRPLEPQAGGRYRPAGPWQHLGVSSRPFAGPLRRQRGLVQVAKELTEEPTGHALGGRVEQSPAAEAWTFLPAAVRQAAERLVPEPDVWLGQITQRSGADGVPFGQAIQVLRMSDTRAVLVVADRSLPPRAVGGVDSRRAQLARAPWLVDQTGANLADPLARLVHD